MAQDTVNDPAVCATLVLFNSERELPGCLDALEPDLADGFAAVVAVDNASPDRSAELFADRFPAGELVRSEQNLGFAGGCNLAWPHIKARYWLLLNPDAVLPPGGLRMLVRWMDEHPDIGAASPALAIGAAPPASAARAFPSAAKALLEATRLHRLLPPAVRARALAGAYAELQQLDADWVPATALIVRREAVLGAGLLDPSFFLYGEDIEWCWRLHRAGWRVAACGAIAVRHDESSSALATYGSEKTQARMIDGVRLACERIRGPVRARLFAGATALALGLEALGRGRPREQRRGAWRAARAWMQSALQ